MPSLLDLATVMVRPRATMHRVLEHPHRWSAEITALAYVCKTVGDSDIRVMPSVLPGLSLSSQLALVTLVLLVGACVWVLALYGFGWIATHVGRQFDGHGTFADVRAALGWGLVPAVWAVLVRIPMAIYSQRFPASGQDAAHLLIEFISRGGCTFAIVLLTLQIIVFSWMVTVASLCVAEAHGFSGSKGLATLAISVLIPIVIVIAAAITFGR